jgi:hypothetical protein
MYFPYDFDFVIASRPGVHQFLQRWCDQAAADSVAYELLIRDSQIAILFA